MIKANRTYLGVRFFDLYAKIQLKRYFREVNVIGDFEDNGKPVLLIANHFSWWDGFIQVWLNKKIFKRKLYVMMLEEQLRKFMILNKGGAFSIRKNSRDIAESLAYTTDLLKQKENMILIFPQGEIQTLYTHDFVFEKGVEYILKKLNGEVQIVFNVNLVDYFSYKKPSLNIYFTPYYVGNKIDIVTIQQDFTRFAHECIKNQIEK
ncbi:1-acyl-sn-glycerol-3-phosphate acyltransferase [Dysgonomonas alginatilytica]|uniref:1-acyl-sn-glycerol-3-phosphate acyltransferase n=1 Tax=Dysgonomonas alginatilytica TaxID=1605892 RepID=A0A2V3PSZ5_9BACT|nr:lysophospholipid acyltransferase family protein [Dysgonomonas alginatilytica]PXV68203.1 1-acyl-sn-glycerol-3-phosphate acyltransferase [Dysgonomonas alginatilytica]